LNISYPDIFTHSIFKRNFWFCKIHLKIKHLHFPLSTQLFWFTFLLCCYISLWSIKYHFLTSVQLLVCGVGDTSEGTEGFPNCISNESKLFPWSHLGFNLVQFRNFRGQQNSSWVFDLS
jgi:hypothetical protein